MDLPPRVSHGRRASKERPSVKVPGGLTWHPSQQSVWQQRCSSLRRLIGGPIKIARQRMLLASHCHSITRMSRLKQPPLRNSKFRPLRNPPSVVPVERARACSTFCRLQPALPAQLPKGRAVRVGWGRAAGLVPEPWWRTDRTVRPEPETRYYPGPLRVSRMRARASDSNTSACPLSVTPP